MSSDGMNGQHESGQGSSGLGVRVGQGVQDSDEADTKAVTSSHASAPPRRGASPVTSPEPTETSTAMAESSVADDSSPDSGDSGDSGGARVAAAASGVAAQLRAAAAKAAASAKAATSPAEPAGAWGAPIDSPAAAPVDASVAAPDAGSVAGATAAAAEAEVSPAQTGAGDATSGHVAPDPSQRRSPVFPVTTAAAAPAAAAARAASNDESLLETTGQAQFPVAPVSPIPAPQRQPRRVRKARLRMLRIDPWSVMKTAFLLSIAAGVMLVVAVAVVWSVLDAAGVFSSVGTLVKDVTASETSAGFDITAYLALSRTLAFTTLLAVVDVILLTALATLGAFLYNLAASLLGGVELTLAEDD